MAGRPDLCFKCEILGNGRCIKNGTECECLNGFIGLSCSVKITTTDIIKYPNRMPPSMDIGPLNAGFIAAGVLGGILFTVIVGILAFTIWRIRRNRRKRSLILSWSTTSTTPVITPPLYTIAISPLSSLESPSPPVNDHIYEELP